MSLSGIRSGQPDRESRSGPVRSGFENPDPVGSYFEWLPNTHTWLFGNEANSVTFYRIFNFGCIAEWNNPDPP